MFADPRRCAAADAGQKRPDEAGTPRLNVCKLSGSGTVTLPPGLVDRLHRAGISGFSVGFDEGRAVLRPVDAMDIAIFRLAPALGLIDADLGRSVPLTVDAFDPPVLQAVCAPPRVRTRVDDEGQIAGRSVVWRPAAHPCFLSQLRSPGTSSSQAAQRGQRAHTQPAAELKRLCFAVLPTNPCLPEYGIPDTDHLLTGQWRRALFNAGRSAVLFRVVPTMRTIIYGCIAHSDTAPVQSKDAKHPVLFDSLCPLSETGRIQLPLRFLRCLHLPDAASITLRIGDIRAPFILERPDLEQRPSRAAAHMELPFLSGITPAPVTRRTARTRRNGTIAPRPQTIAVASECRLTTGA